MKNMGQIMKQVQQLQARAEEVQAKLAATEISGSAGGGAVSVTLTGKGEMRRVKIDPAALTGAGDLEIVEDLIVAAFNDAKAKVEAHAQQEMGKLTAGLPLPPGFKLPL
ncbi:MAG TPA: YbaB/EbfC family nucleoid-associated protein [Alphaproteobacteria bacterium]|jgi:DNA-binding YbaB/EbfC family protein